MAAAVGVDLGGTKLAVGVIDDAGAVLADTRRETPDGAAAVVDAIAELIEELGAPARGLPVGIGAAGFVDAARERVLFAPNLGWSDVPLAAAVAARTGGPVVLENDANAAAWAESRFGAGAGASSMVLVTVGTGIGGGIVLDGALFRGGFGIAGEFGHLPLVAGGRPCGCGQAGCWEQYASGGALSRAADEVGITDVAAAIRNGDPAAIELLAEIGTWLGAGLAAVAAVLDPEVIVVGGGVVANGDLLLEPARSEYCRRLPAAAHRPLADHPPGATRAGGGNGRRGRPGPGGRHLTGPQAQVRVVSYNVRSLRDDADAVAAILRDLAPDLVCVQEAPRFLFSRSKCAALAAAAGMAVLSGGRSAAGNLLLGGARVHLVRASQFRLPRSGRRHRRAVAVAAVEVDGAPVTLAGTHLSLDPLERDKQARRLVSRLPEQTVVLGADVNDSPGSPTWQVLTEVLSDGYAVRPAGGELTFPARDPNRRIDGVFVSSDITVTGCGVPPGLANPAAATDHLPVVADLMVPPF